MNIELHQITDYFIIQIRRKIRAMSNGKLELCTTLDQRYTILLQTPISNFAFEKGNEKRKHMSPSMLRMEKK